MKEAEEIGEMRRDHSRAFMDPPSHGKFRPLQTREEAQAADIRHGDLEPRQKHHASILGGMRQGQSRSRSARSAAPRSHRKPVKTLRVNTPSGRRPNRGPSPPRLRHSTPPSPLHPAPHRPAPHLLTLRAIGTLAVERLCSPSISPPPGAQTDRVRHTPALGRRRPRTARPACW